MKSEVSAMSKKNVPKAIFKRNVEELKTSPSRFSSVTRHRGNFWSGINTLNGRCKLTPRYSVENSKMHQLR